ncbi:ABC transporter ATP-binding protein [Pseudobacillus wudalianchiensis]|uniref:Carnitine transport ATP-binding protein OpuCA n=1 Tax=Pseudobacillus wudalianchiensis TaxID=1743143 RepID=A0A1B9BA39_9BACI|nr:ATP-binding cassette domain-containing protein [Bacillus wudalianchiensis]OCA92955.1 phosphonate ABC transporter ATP-binding protein [Bacillus wudalianchiensis]
MEDYLKIDQVRKKFGNAITLKNLSFSVSQGEFLCLLGPSGCGKTTLLRIIAGLENPSSGRVFINGKDMTTAPPAKRNIGVVFQSYALFPNLTALKNVEFGLKAKKIHRREVREKALEALEMVGLAEKKDYYPAQLSGGQQQRVALARALALSPDILLLDEPLSALDAKVRETLRSEIRSLQERLGITTIMVTHDQEEALTMADKIIVMKSAEIMQIGTPQEIYQLPANPFVADFIGAMNFIHLHSAHSNGQLLAIRPEQIVLTDDGTGIRATVEKLEFRGPIYRGMVTLEDPASLLHGKLVLIDLPIDIVQQRKIKKGSVLTLSLGEKQMLSYQEKVGV